MAFRKHLLSLALTITASAPTFAAVPQQEADQLGGATLTEFGAEKAGNADGSIPAYTGGLPADTAPAGWKAGSGRYDVTPFDNEKPLFSINAANMEKYADHLTVGETALMKKYPDYRLDVYPTHRSIGYPADWLSHCKNNAATVKLIPDGNGIVGGHSCLPFPIPKNGLEAIWNYAMRFAYGTYTKGAISNWFVDGAGHITDLGHLNVYFAIFWPEPGKKSTPDIYFDRHRADFLGPPSQVGTKIIQWDSLNYDEGGQLAWFYSPGQRRTRLAPEFAYDTPVAPYGGAITYDEQYGFNGKPDRFDWKLVGKKEIYVPYNANKVLYAPVEKAITPKGFVNPDLSRFELHRVWVVESTLKPGKRHVYSKRTFYFDEDSWAILASDSYDQGGKLYRVGFFPQIVIWDKQSFVPTMNFYDLTKNSMLWGSLPSKPEDTFYLHTDAIPPDVVSQFTADSMASRGVR